jgi:LysM repeat protein
MDAVRIPNPMRGVAIVLIGLSLVACHTAPLTLDEPSIDHWQRQAEQIAKEMRTEALRMRSEMASTRIAAARQQAELEELREQVGKRRESMERTQKDMEQLRQERDSVLETNNQLKAQLLELPHLRHLADEATTARTRVREMEAALAIRTAELARAKLELTQRQSGKGDKLKKPVVLADQEQGQKLFADPVQYSLTDRGQNKAESVVVRPGDTLWSIAKRYGIAVKTLKLNNQLQNDTVMPGRILTIQPDPPRTSQ